MKKIVMLISVMAACFTLSGCIVVPDGGGPRAHGYYYEEDGYHHGCYRC